jgi:hypothetical protein
VVADVGEQLGAGLDQVEVVGVALLCLVAWSVHVGVLGLETVVDQSAVVTLEKVELPLDQVAEARAPEPHASSR